MEKPNLPKGDVGYTIFPGNGGRVRFSVTAALLKDEEALKKWMKAEKITFELLADKKVKIIQTFNSNPSENKRHTETLAKLKILARELFPNDSDE